MGGDDTGGLFRRAETVKSEEEGQDESDQWEDAESSEEEFFLNPEGRVPFAGEVSFDFRSAPNALTSALSKPGVLDRVIADCQAVFSVRAKKLAYSTGETFWVQADAEPRNGLESLALAIFKGHTAKARFNKTTSGAEWWTQVIEGDDDIGWHWDKDYGMEAQGINVHPCLATVTYLSNLGGPTVILEKRGPMACQDLEGVSGEASRAWISMPRVGKHVCFDGRYLHAAPADLAPSVLHDSTVAAVNVEEDLGSGRKADARGKKREHSGEPKDNSGDASGGTSAGLCPSRGGHKKGHKEAVGSEARNGTTGGGCSNGNSTTTTAISNSFGGGSSKRVTFLVNVWLNHTPRSASPLPAEKASTLGSFDEEFDNLFTPSSTEDDDFFSFVPPSVIRVHHTEAFPSESGTGDGAANGPKDDTGREGCGLKKGDDGESGNSKGKNVQGFQEGISDPSGAGAGAAVDAVDSVAVGMKWEFGEVGDEAEEQVHVRHEVFVPVPVGLTPGWGVGRGLKDQKAVAVAVAGTSVGAGSGGSFCVEYVGGVKPRVRGIDDSGDSDDSDESDGSDDNGDNELEGEN